MGFNNAKILVASSYTWDKKGSNLEKKKKKNDNAAGFQL